MKLRQKKCILILDFKLLNNKINSAYMLSKLSINSQKYFNLRNQQLRKATQNRKAVIYIKKSKTLNSHRC